MMGLLDSLPPTSEDLANDDLGIMPRSFNHLFSAVKSQQSKQPNVRYLIRCSFIEIYNEDLRDLLADTTQVKELPGVKSKSKLEIKESSSQGGVYVKDCIVKMARSPKDLMQALRDGVKSRAVGDT
jgi:hypothetical protein